MASAAALLCAGMSGFSAHALTLGPVQVQSALGEPLRAEVELLDLNPAEAGSVRAEIASEAIFRVIGLSYKPLLSGVQLSLLRTPDGRSVIRLDSKQPVTEPFLDLILDVTWPTGKIARDFTLLFAPPAVGKPVAPALAMANAAPADKVAVAAPDTAPLMPAPGLAEPEKPAATAKPTPAKAEPMPTAADKRVQVKRGDTASGLLMANPIARVSLDQMLVALLRNNPDAFVAGNVNRLVAGAVLAMPTPEQALAVDLQEAKQTIVVQSEDFDAFRDQLARHVGTARTPPPSREASGKVQSLLDEKSPKPAAADKLTLSKGALSGSGAEEKIAQAQQAKDTKERLAELSKNLRELDEASKLTKASGVPATAATTAALAAKPDESLASPAETQAPAGVSAGISGPAGSAIKAQAPADAVKPNLIDRLAQNPLVLPAGGVAGLLLLLTGWVFYRRQRKAAQPTFGWSEEDTDFGAPPAWNDATTAPVAAEADSQPNEDFSARTLPESEQEADLLEQAQDEPHIANQQERSTQAPTIAAGDDSPGLTGPGLQARAATVNPPFIDMDLELDGDSPSAAAMTAQTRTDTETDTDTDFELDTASSALDARSPRAGALVDLDLASISLDLSDHGDAALASDLQPAAAVVPGKSR